MLDCKIMALIHFYFHLYMSFCDCLDDSLLLVAAEFLHMLCLCCFKNRFAINYEYIYFCRLQAGEYSVSRKLILQK